MESIHIDNLFKIKDLVIITKIAKSHEGNWKLNWVPQMDKYLNQIGKVTSITPNGYHLFFGEEEANLYRFPSFSLRKVSEEELKQYIFSI